MSRKNLPPFNERKLPYSHEISPFPKRIPLKIAANRKRSRNFPPEVVHRVRIGFMREIEGGSPKRRDKLITHSGYWEII